MCGWHRYMKLCHTREELARLPQGPKLVLATLPSLHAGCARDLFLEWAPDPKNLVLFTQQAEVWLLCTNDWWVLSLIDWPFASAQMVCCWLSWMGDAGCTPATVLSEHAPCLEEQEGCPPVHIDFVLLGWSCDTLESCIQGCLRAVLVCHDVLMCHDVLVCHDVLGRLGGCT